jgi:hypothetical protein
LTINNCTLTGNHATGSGGGLRLFSGVDYVTFCTITNNTAQIDGGGISQPGSTTTISNSIVAANTCPGVGPDLSGTVTASYSLFQSLAGATILGGTGDLPAGTNPRLGVLQNNGGKVQTQALLPGSPAIDAGDPAFLPPPATDSRNVGFNRIINGRVDIGAYEFQPSATTFTLTSSLNPSPASQAVTFTAVVAAVAPGSNALSGTVTFFIDNIPTATVALVNGVAQFSISTLIFGSHTITAQYSGFQVGDYKFNPSSAGFVQSITLPGAYFGPILVYGTDAGVPAEVRVYNATTGALIYDFFPYGPGYTGGVHVAAGDVHVDGIQDIVTGPGPGGGPLVHVYNGYNLDLIASFNAYNPNFLSGVFVAVGDVNGDGSADIITAPDKGGGPLVEAFDGATYTLLVAFNAYDLNFRNGVRVASGDLNGDGKAEIITAPGAGGGPLVKAFKALTGTLLIAFNAYSPAFRGGVFVAVSDINGDGKDEIITGPGVGGGSQVIVFNGSNGQFVLSFNTYNPLFIGGVRVGGIKDLNTNLATEILTGGGPGGALLQETNTGLSATVPAQIYDGAALAILDQYYPFDTFYFGGYFVAGSR